MMTEIMAIDAITDDRLKAIAHQEDCRVQLLRINSLTRFRRHQEST